MSKRAASSGGNTKCGELLGLKWEDIEFDQKLMHIRRSTLYVKEKGIFDDETKKATSTRTIKLPDAVIDVLTTYGEVTGTYT